MYRSDLKIKGQHIFRASESALDTKSKPTAVIVERHVCAPLPQATKLALCTFVCKKGLSKQKPKQTSSFDKKDMGL